jgi:hypothetical protein
VRAHVIDRDSRWGWNVIMLVGALGMRIADHGLRGLGGSGKLTCLPLGHPLWLSSWDARALMLDHTFKRQRKFRGVGVVPRSPARRCAGCAHSVLHDSARRVGHELPNVVCISICGHAPRSISKSLLDNDVYQLFGGLPLRH